jgi:hypothetical protein
MAAVDIEARLRLIEEHVQAEIDNDMDRIMATWGKSPWFDDVAWEEQWHGRDGIRAHYEAVEDLARLRLDIWPCQSSRRGVDACRTADRDQVADFRDLAIRADRFKAYLQAYSSRPPAWRCSSR